MITETRVVKESHNNLDCIGEGYSLGSPPSLIVREFTIKLMP